jgi:uncharacterized repeat protein (TIGR04076 family)
MELYDLRVTVDSIEGQPVCGLAVGDYIELTNSSQLRLPDGGHFCLYALAAVLPLLRPNSGSCRRRTGWSASRWSRARTPRSG